MCTYINNKAAISGAGKGTEGWFRITEATIGYDHPSFTSDDHAILIDFTSRDGGLAARVGVELDLDSGRTLLAMLAETIRAADASGV